MYMLFKVKKHKCLGIVEKVQIMGFLNKCRFFFFFLVTQLKMKLKKIYKTFIVIATSPEQVSITTVYLL